MTEHRIELVEAGEQHRRYGVSVTHMSTRVYPVAGSVNPTRVEVWDNTGRPNPHPGEVRWNEYGPVGGEGRYLDPHNVGTDEPVSVLLSPEASVVSAHGDGTGTATSGQVWADTDPIGDGDTLVLSWPDGSVSAWTVALNRNGHGHAVREDSDRARNLAARFLPQGNGEGGAPPGIETAGVLVLVYFEDGELCVSVDYDGADASVLTEEGTVPTRVMLGGEVAYRQG